MSKKFIAILLTAVMFQIFCANAVLALTRAEKQAERADKVRAGILKLGVGPDARVALKLRDGVKVAGYISEAKDDSFVVTDLKTSAATTVPYGDVTQIKGHHLGTGAKIAIGIGIGVGLTLLVLYLIFRNYQD